MKQNSWLSPDSKALREVPPAERRWSPLEGLRGPALSRCKCGTKSPIAAAARVLGVPSLTLASRRKKGCASASASTWTLTWTRGPAVRLNPTWTLSALGTIERAARKRASGRGNRGTFFWFFLADLSGSSRLPKGHFFVTRLQVYTHHDDANQTSPILNSCFSRSTAGVFGF